MVVTLTLLATVSGLTLAAAAYHTAMGLLGWRREMHLWFGAVAAAYGAYDLTAIGMYAAQLPDEYGLWLKLHTAANVVALGCFHWFVAAYTGYRKPAVLWSVTAGLGVLLAVTLYMPHGFFYYEVTDLVEAAMPWGERVAYPVGEPHPLQRLVAPLGFGSVAYWLWSVLQQYRRGDRRRALILGGALALFTGIVVFGTVLTTSPMPVLPIDEVGFIAIVLVMGLSLAEQVITARTTEMQLADREAQLQAVVESAPEAIVLVDLEEGSFTHTNEKARDLFQASEDEIRAAHPGTFSPPRQPDGRLSTEAAREYLERAAEGEPVAVDWMLQDTRGNRIPCELRFHRLPDRERRIVRVSLIDRRELRAAEQRTHELELSLRHTQRLKTVGTLAGGIAHDFNNLLLPIMAHADVALSETEEDAPIREDLEGIMESAERARDLVQQLLTFSRQESASAGLVPLEESVERALNLLRATAPASTTIRFENAVGRSCVRADPTQLQQVVMNLATNALHAMPGGGTLSVRIRPGRAEQVAEEGGTTDPDRSWVAVEVEDTGVGMAPELVERIFDPFFTTKEVGAGTGLGLSVVHGIVTRYGGRILVASTPGQGSTFTVLFPTEPEADGDETHDDPAARVDGRGRPILVLDDQEAVAEATARLLRAMGFRATSLTSPKEALGLLTREGAPECVLVDFDMPEMNGEEWTRAALGLKPGLKVLLMTGAQRSTADSARAAGALGLLQKPFTGQALAAAILEACPEMAAAKAPKGISPDLDLSGGRAADL